MGSALSIASSSSFSCFSRRVFVWSQVVDDAVEEPSLAADPHQRHLDPGLGSQKEPKIARRCAVHDLQPQTLSRLYVPRECAGSQIARCRGGPGAVPAVHSVRKDYLPFIGPPRRVSLDIRNLTSGERHGGRRTVVHHRVAGRCDLAEANGCRAGLRRCAAQPLRPIERVWNRRRIDIGRRIVRPRHLAHGCVAQHELHRLHGVGQRAIRDQRRFIGIGDDDHPIEAAEHAVGGVMVVRVIPVDPRARQFEFVEEGSADRGWRQRRS